MTQAQTTKGRWPLAGHLRGLIARRGRSTYGRIAAEAGISRATLHAALAGRQPKSATLDAILGALDATPADLLAAEPASRNLGFPPGRPRREPTQAQAQTR